MSESDGRAAAAARDPRAFLVPGVGEVRLTWDGHLPLVVVDASGTPIESVSGLLRELSACVNGAASVRSYAFDLLRRFRLLTADDFTDYARMLSPTHAGGPCRWRPRGR